MQSERYNIIMSDKALYQLNDYVKFLAKVSETAARELYKEIISEAQMLDFMPETYPWLIADEISPYKYRKKLVAKRYLLIYQIKDNTVFIDYIADCRQDYRWLI